MIQVEEEDLYLYLLFTISLYENGPCFVLNIAFHEGIINDHITLLPVLPVNSKYINSIYSEVGFLMLIESINSSITYRIDMGKVMIRGHLVNIFFINEIN